ncbi:hypothetical protein V8B97DRAFT_1639363 [Scleroderma yunnanense]
MPTRHFPFIRSFHSSALFIEYSPNAKRLCSPSRHGTQYRGRVWAALGCAERVAGVGTMRGLKDLPLDVSIKLYRRE